jgi:hypothetical protein
MFAFALVGVLLALVYFARMATKRPASRAMMTGYPFDPFDPQRPRF